MVIDTKPFVVAIPIVKLARKSAVPIKIRSGNVLAGMPPSERKRSAIMATIETEVTRIVVMVNNELSCDPIAINVSAVPKPKVAPSASINGLSGRPLRISGPLAQNAPMSAIAIPTSCNGVGRSPLMSATVSGINAPSELMGETTPMRPVASPA